MKFVLTVPYVLIFVPLKCCIKTNEKRTGDIPYYVTDYSKINNLSNWEPQISIEKTLEGIYEWVLKNKSKIIKSL